MDIVIINSQQLVIRFVVKRTQVLWHMQMCLQERDCVNADNEWCRLAF